VTGEAVIIRKLATDKPFLWQSFGRTTFCLSRPEALTGTTSVRSPLVQYGKSLFSLGIMLVELWYGKRLENPRPLAELLSNDMRLHGHLDYKTCDERIEEIETEAGPMYGNAVRRCIRGVDFIAKSLEHDGFKNEVHEQVITQLELNWKEYENGYNDQGI